MSRPPSARSRDDEVLKGDIARIHDDHHDGIYGIEKVWWQCQREGIDVGRDRVARLMARSGYVASCAAATRRPPPRPTLSKSGQKTWSNATSSQRSQSFVGGGHHVRLDLGRFRLYGLCY